jgi:hypothetical protein
MKLATCLNKKFLLPVLMFAAVVGVKQANASTYSCIWYDPLDQSFCVGWMPGLPPNSYYCNDGQPPASGYVNIYTAPNQQGTCVAIPATTAIPNLSAYGWDNPDVASNLTVQSWWSGAYIEVFGGTNYNNYDQWGATGWAYNTSGSVGSLYVY